MKAKTLLNKIRNSRYGYNIFHSEKYMYSGPHYNREVKNLDAFYDAYNSYTDKEYYKKSKEIKNLYHSDYRTNKLNAFYRTWIKELKYFTSILQKYFPDYKINSTGYDNDIEIIRFRVKLSISGELIFRSSLRSNECKIIQINTGLPLKQFAQEIRRHIKNQLCTDTFLEYCRYPEEREEFLFELIKKYKINCKMQIGTPYYSLFGINKVFDKPTPYDFHDHFIKRLRKKKNIILINSQDPERDYYKLIKEPRAKNPRKINADIWQLTYWDIEDHILYEYGEDIDEDTIERAFYELTE